LARRTYNLHGIVVQLDAVDEALAGFLEPILAPLRADEGAADWTVRIETVPAVSAAPVHIRPVWDGALPEGLPATLYDDGDRRIFVAPGHFTMVLRRGVRATDIEVAPAGRKALGGTAAFWLLDRVLVAFDHHLLHGACLVRSLPRGAVAVFAPSGTGKTTTSLALARAGLALAADDALVLRNTEGGSLLWGVPRRLRIHRKTAELMPWLAGGLAAWQSDEQAIEREKLADVISIAGPELSLALGAIMLRPPNRSGHQIAQIAKTEAVSHIATDNVRRAPGGVEANAQAAFAAIAQFVARTPVIALSVGPDPASIDLDAILAAFG
jgi:hypothetical protein